MDTAKAEDGGRTRRAPLAALVDRFVPPRMQGSGEDERRARMFLGSHLYGPFLGLAVILTSGRDALSSQPMPTETR